MTSHPHIDMSFEPKNQTDRFMHYAYMI